MTTSVASDQVRPPNSTEPELGKLRILSIDGGGIRGVIPAVFLAELEGLLQSVVATFRNDPAQASVVKQWDGVDEPRIADCFHLIAGTSTGGLLTAGLTTTTPDGRPRLSAADAVAVYERHGAKIFHRPLLRQVFDHFGLLFPRYPLAQLRKALQDPSVMGDGLLKHARTDVLITSYDTKHASPRFFTRWGAPGADTQPASPPEAMVDVALATAAAPTYFDPKQLESSPMVDGGVYAGNPALAAISMALRRTDGLAPDDPRDLFMLSLGTGAWERPLNYGWGGIIGWLRPRRDGEALLEALLGGQGDFATEAAHMMLNGWPATRLPGAGSPAQGAHGAAWWDPNLPPASVGGGPRFWRYQPALPGPWALDDVNRLEPLKELGLKMTQDHRAELERLADLLVRAGPVPDLPTRD